MDHFKLTDKQFNDYEKDGFIIIRHFFNVEEIQPLQKAIIKDPSINGSLYGMIGDTETPHPFCAWQECANDIVGMLPRMERTLAVVESLLKDECYHWHSKFVVKPAKCQARVGWHQDYASWYDDGVPAPNMLTMGLAITATNKANGCTHVVPGSHKMGRFDYASNDTENTYKFRLEYAKEKYGFIYCELNPGDAMFFHCNVLHAADENNTDQKRIIMFSSYNSKANSPIAGAQGANEEGAFMNITKEQRCYKPLLKVADDSLLKRAYQSAFQHTKFISPQTNLNNNFVKAVKLK